MINVETKRFAVICIEKDKSMQDVDAKFLELGSFLSNNVSEIESSVSFDRDIWRVCAVYEV